MDCCQGENYMSPVYVKSHQLPDVAAEVDEGEAEVGHQVVADEAQSDLTEERTVEVGVHEVGDQGQQQEEGGDQEGGRVENKGELFSILLFFFFQTESECNLQICIRVSGRVDLLEIVHLSILYSQYEPGGISDRTQSCCRGGWCRGRRPLGPRPPRGGSTRSSPWRTSECT